MVKAILVFGAILTLATAAQAERTVYQMGSDGMTIYQSSKDALTGSTVIQSGPNGTRVTVGQRGIFGGSKDVTISAPWQRQPDPTATQMIMDDLDGDGE